MTVIDWILAEKIAGYLAGAGDAPVPRADLPALAVESERRVTAYTGLEPARPLPPDVRHNIFLVVKEALTNALKHAAAREVWVQASLTGDTLEIQVKDDGKGHDPAVSANGEKRHGLNNMRRRAEAIGATLEFQSAPGHGSVVKLKLNLPAPVAGKT